MGKCGILPGGGVNQCTEKRLRSERDTGAGGWNHGGGKGNSEAESAVKVLPSAGILGGVVGSHVLGVGRFHVNGSGSAPWIDLTLNLNLKLAHDQNSVDTEFYPNYSYAYSPRCCRFFCRKSAGECR